MNEEIIDYNTWVGKKVSKKNRHKPKNQTKPFKSGSKINTVKGIIDHPIRHVPAFTFEEDNSFVACEGCKLI